MIGKNLAMSGHLCSGTAGVDLSICRGHLCNKITEWLVGLLGKIAVQSTNLL